MKQSNMLLIATSILGMSVGGVQASVAWDGYSISYGVSANGTNVTTADPFSGQVDNSTTISGPVGSKQKALFDSGLDVDASINSTASGTVGGIQINMNTGATGGFTNKGITVSGWQNITTSANNGLSDLSVETPTTKTQNLNAFNRRAFKVDAAGDYILKGALLSGVTNVQNLISNNGPGAPANIVDYEWNAEIRLETSVVNGNGDFIRNESDVATLVLDLTQPLDELTQLVHLERSAGAGEFYRYLLKTQISLKTTVNNRDFFFGDFYGQLAEGTFGTMGTFANPFTVSGTINPVPVPGAVVFFISGMLGLFGVSRRRVQAG